MEGSISKKRSRKRSEVWHHFEETSDGKRAICKYCSKSLGAESKAGTTHLKRHLEICQKSLEGIDQPLTKGVRDEVRKFRSTSEKTWDVEVKKAIVAEVPFAPSVSRKAYSRLMGVMDVDKEVCSYYEHEKEKLANQFQYLTSRVCFSYEIMKELKYISITAHFIDEDFNLVKIVIGFKKLADISVRSCVVALEKCISDWKLGDKLFSITGNDYSEYVSESLRKDFSPKMLLEGRYFRVPCYKNGLRRFYSSYVGPLCFTENANIEKLFRGLKDVRCQMDTFNQITKEWGLPPINKDRLNQYAGKCLSWTWHTRSELEDPEYWEPAVKMFKEAILYRGVFSQYANINSHSLAKGHEGCLKLENWDCNGLDYGELFSFCRCTELSTSFLYDFNWERVEAAVKLSNKVHEICDIISGFNCPTSNLYLRDLADIEDIMSKKENFQITINKDMRYYYLGFAIWDNISYYTMNKVYFVACVLDPRYKLIFLKYYFEKTNRPEFAKKEDINEILELLQKTFGAYVKEKTNESANPQEEGCTSNSTHESNQIIDGFYRYTKELKKKTPNTELEEYLDDELVDLDDASFNLLGWWKQNRLRYPVLSRMVRDVLAIPTCAYSMKGNISSDFADLKGVSPQLVEAVICSKDWILSDILQSIPELKN